jgi:hypothetical protein
MTTVWAMIFVFFSPTNVHVEYGSVYPSQEECIKATEFEHNGANSMRAYCLPVDGSETNAEE